MSVKILKDQEYDKERIVLDLLSTKDDEPPKEVFTEYYLKNLSHSTLTLREFKLTPITQGVIITPYF